MVLCYVVYVNVTGFDTCKYFMYMVPMYVALTR